MHYAAVLSARDTGLPCWQHSTPAGFLGWKSRVKMQVNKRLAGCILAGIFAANTAEFPASVGATTGACHK